MRKFSIMLILVMVLLAFNVSAGKLIQDIDTGGTNWNGNNPSDDDQITTGGWALVEGGNAVRYQDDGQDYDGDGFAWSFVSDGSKPAYSYTNASQNLWNYTIMFYDDATDNSMLTTFGTGFLVNRMGVWTDTSTTHYFYFTGAVYTASSVARSTGWHNFTYEYNGTYTRFFIDGTMVYAKTQVAVPTIAYIYASKDYPCATCYWDYAHFWNSTEDVAPVIPQIHINLTIDAPRNDSFYTPPQIIGNNSRFWINITHNATGNYNASLNDTRFSLSSNTTTQRYYLNNTALAEGKYYITVNINQTGSYNNSKSVMFEIDLTAPFITINPTNYFSSLNNTIISNYSIPYNYTNITIWDLNLYYTNYTIFRSGGSRVYNNYTAGLGTSVNYLDNISFSWGLDNYTVYIESSDSHTAKYIKDYGITIKNSLFKRYLEFDTAEGNLIRITPEYYDLEDIKTNKHTDKYNFEFTYSTDKERTYFVKSDHKLNYIAESEDIAHFVTLSAGVNGNWLDFNADGLKKKDVTVIKVSDYEYRVTINKKLKKIKFKSLGGLNYNSASYNFMLAGVLDVRGYFNNITTTFNNFSVFLNSSSYNFHNVTHSGIGFIKDIPAGYYNLTLIPEGDYTRTTEEIYINQSVYNYSNIFTRTNALEITLLDENTGNLILENITILINSPSGANSYITNTGRFYTYELGDGKHSIRAGNANYTDRYTYTDIYNETSTNITIYLLKDSDGNDITFRVIDTGINPIEDVRIIFTRQYGLSYLTVAQIETDYAGQARVLLDQDIEYRLIFDHADYTPRTIDLTPINSQYDVTLSDSSNATLDNIFYDVAYTINPINTTFGLSEVYRNFSIQIYSSNGWLENWGVTVIANSSYYECIPASCIQNITGSVAGGTTTLLVKGNATGYIEVKYFFKTLNVNPSGQTYTVIQKFGFFERLAAATSLFSRMDDLKTGKSNLFRYGVSIVGTLALVGTAAEIGIIGIPLAIIAVTGFAIFAIMGFISKVLIGLLAIVAFVAWLAMRGND